MLSIVLTLLAASEPRRLSPPVITVSAQGGSVPERAPAYEGPIDVALRQGPTLLWQGRVEVAGDSPTHLSFTLNQPRPGGDRCPELRSARQGSTGYRLTIQPRRHEGTGTFGVQAEWIRLEPPGSAGCGAPSVGTRTVRIDDVVRLEAAGRVVLRGDADFSVALARP